MQATHRPIHLLLVEDDDDHAELILRNLALHAERHSVDRVADGAAALAYLRRLPPYALNPIPDVVLLDLKLPKLDGHEVLAQMKSDPRLSRIPVVVLTTSDAQRDRALAYDCHVNSYLVKPLDFSKFCELVEEVSHYWGERNCPAPPT